VSTRDVRRKEIELGRDGERLELLVGGISYSSFHPDRPWTGYVWDALAAAVLLSGRDAPTVLLLGCGAGTTLALLRVICPRAQLTAVELDGRILELARERFRLDEIGAEVLHDDGLRYLARTRRRFDVIIDDMFGPAPGGVMRPVTDETAHLARIASRLTPHGIAATNATTDDDPPGLYPALRRAHAEVFGRYLRLKPPLGYNVVLAGSRHALRPGVLRDRASRLGAGERLRLDAIRVQER